MSWHYVESGHQHGPVEEDELVRLVSSGALDQSALVWQEGQEAWKPLSESLPQVLESAKLEMAVIGDAAVTASEKDIVVQKLREGVEVELDDSRYGGYWIRAVARIIDAVVVFALSFVVSMVFSIGAIAVSAAAGSPILALVGQIVGFILQIAVTYGYPTWMVGKFGATLGKMAVGLKVVKPSGGRVSYLLAFGRSLVYDFVPALIATVVGLVFALVFFAILGFDLDGDVFDGISRGQQVGLWVVGVVGSLVAVSAWHYCYAMAAWDREKRTLHDHVCSTRVVFK